MSDTDIPRTPILDRSVGLLATGGDSALLEELVILFLETAPPQLALMKTAIIEGDTHAVRHEAHSLKGAAGALGATRIRDLAAEIEVLSDRDDLESSRPLLESVEYLLVQLKREFSAVE